MGAAASPNRLAAAAGAVREVQHEGVRGRAAVETGLRRHGPQRHLHAPAPALLLGNP